jgi:hypothetical protein
MDYLNIGNYGQKSLDKTNDILVLTRLHASSPFSFINRGKYKYNENCPAPVYLTAQDFNKLRKFGIDQLEIDFQIRPNGELKLTNEILTEKQKGVITDILKKATALFFEGKSFVNLSLPIRIFEPRSQMERLCDTFHFFPHYAELAVATKVPSERIKLVLTSIFAALHHCTSQSKPFNPFLGETYQGTIGTNSNIYLEHICHHPPISAYFITNPNFKISGSWTYDAKLGANKFETINKGFMQIDFNDGMKIKCVLPIGQINGTLVGERTFKFIHSFFAFEETSCTKGVITFADGKKGKNFISSMFSSKGRIDIIGGQIYRYDKAVHEKLLAENWHKMLKNSGKMSDCVEKMSNISGSWLKDVSFDEKVYWSLDKDQKLHHQQKVCGNPLPSDARFREDLVWLFYGNEKYAQEWKLLLEANQRADRERRNEHKNNKK